METNDYTAKIFYHFFNKYYNLMLNTCKSAIVKYPSNVGFKLYHSLALILTNRLEEGIHDMEGFTDENDIKLAATIALMYSHKLLGVANRDLFVKLDAQMKEYRKNTEAQDYYYSAFVLVALSKPEKALDYADKAVSIKNESEFLTLKGWILLMLKTLGKHNALNIKSIFNSAWKQNSKDILAILGYTECCLHLGEYPEALSYINQAVVRCPATNLPLLQKVKIHFASQEWDQTSDTISRFPISDEEILYGLKYEIMINLCHKANYKEACSTINRFTEILRKYESGNSEASLEASRLFSKLCDRNEDVLMNTIAILNGIVETSADIADVVVELGNQHVLLGKIKEANRLYKSATKIDESSFDAFLGLSWCEYLENGKSKQLYKQIDYLLELKDAENSLRLRLLRAKASEHAVEPLNHLKYIFDNKTHLSKLNYYSDKYLINLDPEFTVCVIKEYLNHVSNSKNTLENALELANLVVHACPSLSGAMYLQAKLLHLKGDSSAALSTLETMMGTSESASSDVSLLMAEIQVKNGQYERASQSLEVCISYNFKVRENPLYHYIKGLVEKNTKNYGDAIKALRTALSLVSNTEKNVEVALVDKASIYVELIDTLNIIGQTDESLKVLEEATRDLQETPEESRILLLSADNMLIRKNIQGAIDLLNRIGKNESCYSEARMKIADVMLKYRKDKYAFLQVYQDFVEENPCSDSYLMLGDAFMKVLEPDDALENYEKALKENPSDPFLTSKMGKALVESHYFNRAVDYYKKAIKESSDFELKLQLATLYLNLREYEKGELILLNELEEESSRITSEDLSQLQDMSKLYQLLAQIQEKSGNLTYAVKSLKDALDAQVRVRKRLTLDYNGSTEEVDQNLVNISIKLGEMAMGMKNYEQAVNYYKDGLIVSPNNVSILVALAKLYMQMNYLELCQQTCSAILRIDSENEVASVLMADIAFRKVDFDMANFHFTQLITKQPTNWDALIRFIEISRRMGTIQECEEYINAAEKFCTAPLKDPGFLYCKAYYQWHSGNLNAALKNFNQVRQDSEYGTKAIYNMIEICLNPEDEMAAEQFMESDDIEYRDSRSLALKTAERLIKELKQRLESNGGDLSKCRILANFRLLATKEKYNIERALEDFVAIASENTSKDNLSAILGIATAHILLKQLQRAKNQLKRVVKNAWNFEDSEYLERCWLLLADQYIQSNKLDSASEILSKIVQFNKSCTKAFEYLGYIAEKEHKFKDASNHYLQAWQASGKTNPSVGHKLAYCLMKSKKYPDAIDVANEVLRLNPEYPMMKKDILDKCMNNLRI